MDAARWQIGGYVVSGALRALVMLMLVMLMLSCQVMLPLFFFISNFQLYYFIHQWGRKRARDVDVSDVDVVSSPQFMFPLFFFI
jgi:hypothetical protein